MKNTIEISRRQFLKVAGVFAGATALGSVVMLNGCGRPTAPVIDKSAYSKDGNTLIVSPDRIPELSNIGGSASIMNESEQVSVIVARIERDGYVAAANECTHRERPLGYDHGQARFFCASGKSWFGLDGGIIEGPAEGPLRLYECHLEQGKLVIDLT